MILALIVLWVGWLAFIFAVVNIVATSNRYIHGTETGFCAIMRLLLFSTALTVWYYIVFYKFPLLLIISVMK